MKFFFYLSCCSTCWPVCWSPCSPVSCCCSVRFTSLPTVYCCSVRFTSLPTSLLYFIQQFVVVQLGLLHYQQFIVVQLGLLHYQQFVVLLVDLSVGLLLLQRQLGQCLGRSTGLLGLRLQLLVLIVDPPVGLLHHLGLLYHLCLLVSQRIRG